MKDSGLRVSAYAGSDVGRVRKGNEDAAFAGTTAFAVADGMGGHVAGEVASETALEPIRDLDGITFRTDKAARQALVDAIAAANRSVVEKADADPSFRGMGTTLTAAVVQDAKLHVAHVGDSRAYLLRRDGTFTQLTTDHTLVEQLVQEGRLSRDEAANHPQRSVITRAIGIETEVEVDTLPSLTLQAGDQVLLCSDGLTGPVDDSEITDLLTSVADGQAACEALIAAANAAGGPDNITVVLLRVEDGAHPPAAGTQTAQVDDAARTEELSSPVVAPPEPPRDGEGITQIRTRQETGRDWATSLREYGAAQGADTRSVRGTRERRRAGRSMRILAVVVGLGVILGLIGVGGLLLLSRAWFVGVQDDGVAIFRGVPSEVAGVRLSRVVEATDVSLDDLPARRAERIRQGVTFGSESEAREFVETLRDDIQARPADADQPDAGEPEAGTDAPDAPSAEPTP